MKNFPRPSMIMILDGFGLNSDTYGNAIAAANTPNLDRIFSSYPHTSIKACGSAVGLPDGQMGNSEVGHLNIGSGRIVYQELSNISNSISEGSFAKKEAFVQAMKHCKQNDSCLHLLGLLSDGGVHSHIEHLLALLDMAKNHDIKDVFIHCLLDGRDVPPRCAEIYILQLEEHINNLGIGKIATIGGRYYGMDRDKRWDRVEKAYNAISLGGGIQSGSALSALYAAYDRGEDDEFVQPTVIGSFDNGFTPMCRIEDGDSMVMFNFRPDRAREISHAFTNPVFDGFQRKKIYKDLYYVTMTDYDKTLTEVHVAFGPQKFKNTLGEYLSGLNLKQLRIAETEKYAHVTFFFNGGVEKENPGEDRILIPSPKVATYDLQPEMSAYEVTKRVIEEINSDKYDVIILNFANADMVGHTGNFPAAVNAIEALDSCVSKIADAMLAKDGQILLTADHGNADAMLNPDGSRVTAHSLNDVPLVHISKNARTLKSGGKLADIAPTLLQLMGIEVPAEMTGNVLI